MSRKIRILAIMILFTVFAGILPACVSADEQEEWSKANSYMTEELTEAQSLGLIPDYLTGADFTQP